MKSSRVLIGIALLLCAVIPLFAGGREEILPPQITLDLPGVTYLSPGISDGTQDTVSWTTTMSADERMVVKGYRVIVTNESGEETYRFEETYPNEQPFFQRMFIGIGFARFKESVVVPETLSWDALTTDGAPVQEGTYSIRIEGWDDQERTGASDSYTIIIDNTPPSADITLPYTVFSPNADGNKDILIVDQTGSVEQAWTGSFIDSSGETVSETTWESAAPGNVTWNGTDSAGDTAPDGDYSYVLSATDLAGNAFSVTVVAISIDTQDTPISLSRDVGFFSPNRDGSIDEVAFTFEVPVIVGIREWNFEITDAEGTVRRTLSGIDIPAGIEFDGRSDSGETLPQGTYRGQLSVLYVNGNNPSAQSTEFVLDITAPVAYITAFPLVFSPNGDGSKDTIRVDQETSSEEVWVGTILDQNGLAIRRVEWRGRAGAAIVWDGRDEDGSLVPDGVYGYLLSSTDRAGNYAEVASEPFRIDTRETLVGLAADGTYFSPNADGVRDTIAFLPEIHDPEGVNRLTLTVSDENANVVRSFAAAATRAEIIWNGRNDADRQAPNGSYSVLLSVEYENGNNPTARIGRIVIDRNVPTVTVTASETIFSPDGDGSLDSVRIGQSGASNEDSWIGRFYNDNDEPIRTLQWSGIPGSFAWDGTDDDGNRVEDGVYRYVLSSTDRAGNTGTGTVDRLTIDTRPTPVSLRIGSSAFSPDGDGVRDSVTITPALEVVESIVSWTLVIADDTATELRAYSGTDSAPEPIEFDGRDDAGELLPEGTYTARLSILYRNGNRPAESSPPFTVDITDPWATVTASTNLFSPNGDGRKDTVAFNQSGSEEESWNGRIIDEEGAVVREYSWFGTLQPTVAWDGKDGEGRIVADGTYRYVVSATDRAGNESSSNPVEVRIDNRPTPISVAADLAFISPNGDGVQDTLRITPTIGLNAEVSSYLLEIVGTGNQVVGTFRGTGRVPTRFTWDGQQPNGRSVRDGIYFATLRVEYSKGDRPEARSAAFVIDTVAPTAQIRASETLFSPDGDGRKDGVAIEQESSDEEVWEAEISGSDGAVVRTEFWRGVVENFTWDGKDDDGSIVPDGSYRYQLTATDSAGNSISRVIPEIRVDTRVASAFISLRATEITPNGDGEKDTVRMNLYPSLTDGIIEWSLVILDENGRSVRNLTSGSRRAVPATATWDGRRDDRRIVDGEYTPRLTIEYEKGNLVDARSSEPILLDLSGPTLRLGTSPTPFSPDDDGENDVVRIAMSGVNDASRIVDWRIDIFDPRGNLFYQRSGSGRPPASIQWDGYSADGELVQAAEDYLVQARLTDALGNVGEQTVILPIDVLVLRDGDNLKIRISSIQFAPNSADFLGFDEEKAARNLRTLTRLAEILRKYASYEIRIEGHAVSVYWDDPARARREETEELAPLSKARADAVKSGLVDLGIPAEQMTTVGMGGTQPLVPHSDLENRWKSRRVEFILIR